MLSRCRPVALSTVAVHILAGFHSVLVHSQPKKIKNIKNHLSRHERSFQLLLKIGGGGGVVVAEWRVADRRDQATSDQATDACYVSLV